jgi:threonine dehydrogenase-like Zn-dependent dehydrogenase
VVAVDPDPERRKLAATLGASHVLDPTDEEPVGLQLRALNDGHGVDVAIEVSGSDRGLQGALEAAGLGATVVAAGFYQGGAANVRLGEEFHHNRLSLIASIGAWGAPHRHAPLWNRRRVMETAARLLYTDRVSVEGLLGRRFPFAQAPAAFRWIDEHPQAAVKVALGY